MRTKGDGAKAASAAISDYQQQVSELDAERGRLGTNGRQIRLELEVALRDTAITLLPDSTIPTLQRAATEAAAPWLVTRRGEYVQKRERAASRLAAIDGDPHFQQRHALMDPQKGYGPKLQQAQQAIAQARTDLERFRIEPFLWLENREIQRQFEGSGAFSSFWRTITLVNHREEKAKQQCATELGFESYEAFRQSYEATQRLIAELEDQIEQLGKGHQQLTSLLEERAELNG